MASEAKNLAAWIPTKGAQVKIGPAETYTPGPDELLVRNHAVAINPVDWIQQESGLFVKHFPAILGCDTAGTILAVGSNVSTFKTGDRILAHCAGILTNKDSDEAFQTYSIVPTELAAVIPDDMSFETAAVVPLALSTAAAGLYEEQNLALPLPSATPKESGKTLLVWAGSTSVGSCVIQLAVASGFSVVTTASKHNFEYCEKLGARKVFDHYSPSVVGDLVAELSKGEFAGAYDAIAKSLLQVVDVVSQLGGGKVASVLPLPEEGIPATVKATSIFGIPMGNGNTVGKSIYNDFLPHALKSGQFKPMPPAKVVGEGLEAIQAAMDELKAGVSASKLVVKL